MHYKYSLLDNLAQILNFIKFREVSISYGLEARRKFEKMVLFEHQSWNHILVQEIQCIDQQFSQEG